MRNWGAIVEYVAIDVETANNESGSICSIGLALFVGGSLVDEYYSLVRPPEELDEFNCYCSKVHGITLKDVEQEPSYYDLHGVVDAFIGGRLLVAHNASFDARHLQTIMGYYDFVCKYTFACTLSLARRMLVLPNYRLQTVCNALAIKLEHHHNALDDAIACGKVYAQLSARDKV